ncbi:MAG: DNA replication complex GINS family protein [Nanohaloarchaea archaeon]|nr:DNA replication complex GINS family protein [Candidatus Nanohaloarchaea archaeon]
MSEDALTFSELRKIEKKEKRQEELSVLDDSFFLKVSQYLDLKDGVDEREYRNAKRVFDKIIGLRQEKIVKNARISVKTGVKASELNLLPREQSLFLDLKEMFEDYSEEVDEVLEGGTVETPDIEEEPETEPEPESEPEPEVEEDEGGVEIKIVSQVPEFMGTDLESYGPFEEGDQVNVPEENAEILVNRGNAEMVE